MLWKQKNERKPIEKEKERNKDFQKEEVPEAGILVAHHAHGSQLGNMFSQGDDVQHTSKWLTLEGSLI